MDFSVETVELGDGRTLYLFVFEPVGQEAGDEDSP
jgi:hypothetical protein